MDFFKQLGFGNLRCLTFELAYVNVKKGENFYESILNVLIPKGIRFLLKLDNKAFFKKSQFTFHLILHLEITLNKEKAGLNFSNVLPLGQKVSSEELEYPRANNDPVVE